MHDRTNLPVPKQTDIRADCATLFVSLELSRSTWVATSLAPGSKKMSKHTLVGGNGRELLRFSPRRRCRNMQHLRWERRSRCATLLKSCLDRPGAHLRNAMGHGAF